MKEYHDYLTKGMNEYATLAKNIAPFVTDTLATLPDDQKEKFLQAVGEKYQMPLDILVSAVSNHKLSTENTRSIIDKRNKTTTKAPVAPTPKKVFGKPTFPGETLPLTEKSTSSLEKVGVNTEDLVKLQDYLSQGFSLKQIAQGTGMPTDIFNAVNEFIVKK